MKKLFSTGLAILLPIVLTGMIVSFLIHVLTKPFLGFTKPLIAQLNFFKHSFFLFSEETLVTMTSKVLILLFLLAFITLMGLIGKLFFMDYLFRLGNYLIQHTPFINKVYKPCQDVVNSLFSSSKSFSQVVLVPFPTPHALTIGLVTHDSLEIKTGAPQKSEWVSVFVPGSPIPSIGFMFTFKREQLIFVDMKVNEAMKFIVSCGIVMPNFAITHLASSPIYEQNTSSESHLLPCER